MKQVEEKFKRKVKYWRVSYQQTNGRERLFLALYGVIFLIYTWWYLLLS